MKYPTTSRLLLALMIPLVLWACAPTTPTPPEAGERINLETSIAETVFAQVTRSAIETKIAQLTQIAGQPSVTPPPTVPTPILFPTSTPLPPTPTQQPAIATPTPGPCVKAELVADPSPLEGLNFTPGANFNKLWRLRNAGSCAWTSAYSLVLYAGDAMGATSPIALPYSVMPGETVDIVISFTAPDESGLWFGNWMLRNPQGGVFGLGPDAQEPLQVQIRVVGEAIEGLYDLALNYCQAHWRSPAGLLPCPGVSSDTRGSVRLLTSPKLETRQEDELAIWARPSQSSDGWISGQYPLYRIQEGDHFLSEVGCLEDSPGCDVLFQLNYQLLDGTTGNLGSWREEYDGDSTRIDIDLSGLKDRSVQLFLEVFNYGDSEDANAFWLVPQIHNTNPTRKLVLNWTREGGIRDTCNQLRVYLLSNGTGEAQASSCENGFEELGVTSLSNSEYRQLANWVDWYAPFEASTYSPTREQAKATSLSFHGEGEAEAFSSDIQAIQRFAENLFMQIAQ